MRAVIDASGTYESPSPMGAGGVFVAGERRAHRTVPRHPRRAGRRPRALRGQADPGGGERTLRPQRAAGAGGAGGPLAGHRGDLGHPSRPARPAVWWWRARRARRAGRLGSACVPLVEGGAVRLGGAVLAPRAGGDGAGSSAIGGMRRLLAVDEVVVATGYRPELGVAARAPPRVRPGGGGPAALRPAHRSQPALVRHRVPARVRRSCGTPSRDLYVVGIKGYGRAPTFLLLTGYEQVRSVVAALTGDLERPAPWS